MALFDIHPEEIETFGDAFQYIELLESIGSGAFVDADAPVRNISSSSFVKIAFIGFEKTRIDGCITNGNTSKFRDEITRMAINTTSSEMWVAGMYFIVNDLHLSKDISDDVIAGQLSLIQRQHDEIWRESARLSGAFLSKMQAIRDRKGHRGRPKQARNGDALANLVDSRILSEAANGLDGATLENIEAALPNVVRDYLDAGHLQALGDTRQNCVDRHCKRLRSKLREQAEQPRLRENSIIRKSQ